MNELHEQYETLRRRGMPEHPRIEWADGECVYTSGRGMAVFRVCRFMDEADARDLLTMHALRWFVADVDAEPVIEHWPARTKPTGNPAPGFDIQYMLRGDNTTGYDAFGETLLTAIIAATAHLEPKP